MRKLSVAIVEDEAAQRLDVARLVSRWGAARGLNVAVASFASAEEALFEWGANGFDLVVLDIQMPGLDGMSLAKRLRAEGLSAQIIFLSAAPEYLAEGYEVEALRFLVKPVDEGKLFEALDAWVVRAEKAGRVVLLCVDGENVRVLAEDVRYAEAFSHYVEVHLAEGCLRVKMPLGELEGLLGEGFFRCHRSYVAGMRFVRAVGRAGLTLEGGAVLPLARGRFDAANEAFIKYNWG